MAKTDAFFIRATVPTNGTTYAQAAIDLGAYVDALGKSVLRIHNIAVQYGSPLDVPTVTANSTNGIAFQVKTQTQTDMVSADDRSLIAGGKLVIGGDAGGVVNIMSESLDVAPQHWTKGYLVGVETVYLATDATANVSLDEINVVMECTVETLSQSAAMALALSQQ